MKTYIFKYFLIITIFLTGNFSCSQNIDPVGIYVHYRETQKYYTLTIERKNENNYKLKFEGVPLDNFESTPSDFPLSLWTYNMMIRSKMTTQVTIQGTTVGHPFYSSQQH